MVLLAKPFDWPVAWNWKRSRPELKAIMGFHGTDYFAGDTKFYGAIDAAFAVSPSVADLAEERVGRRPVLIPNPVDVDFFQPEDEGKSKSGTEEWQLVSSGRLVGWKGFGNLIEALARLRDEHGISARLSLAGEGPERGVLEAKMEALGLADQVKLHGLLDAEALRALLRAGDLYVLPSIGLEAFSISALEAGCVGLPLALSDQVGLASYLNEADAVAYPARDVGALGALLKDLHGRRNDGAWTDRAARHARLRRQFSPEIVAQRILDLVREDARG
jgi:glycosyltransferase involved in cell wall biosynthesis